MGSNLIKCKRHAKAKLSGGSTVGGQGRFTEAVIDNFRNYHGAMIRNNKNAVHKMKEMLSGLFITTAFYVIMRHHPIDLQSNGFCMIRTSVMKELKD